MSVIRNAFGEPFSRWKPADKFLWVWNEEGLPGGQPQLEYEFHEDRDWRFDYAWPELRVAVEIDGFGYGHQAQQHLANQNEKQNAALLAGWIVLRYNSRQLGSKQAVSDAVEEVARVLCQRGGIATTCRLCGDPAEFCYCQRCLDAWEND